MLVSKMLAPLALLCLAAIVTSSYAQIQSSDICSAEEGFAYSGNDIGPGGGADTWQECCATCLRHERCTAFTFNSKGKFCRIKHRAVNPRHCRGCYSQKNIKRGPHVCSAIAGADYRGGDIRRIPSVKSWAACCALCDKHSSCKGYTWKTTKACWLKHTVSNYIPCDNCYTQKLDGPLCDALAGKAYDGDDIRTDDNVKSWEGCCAKCSYEPKCKGYTWNSKELKCYLKSTLTRLRSNPDAFTQKFGDF